MNQLTLHRGVHVIERDKVYDNILELYGNEDTVQEYPFRITFKDERAVDFGGVTRDMFSGFFNVAYTQLFDGTSLVTPTIHPGTDFSIFRVLGSVISHAYLVSGVLPIRIAFPCLAGILCGNFNLPEEVLIATFIDSLSLYDSKLMTEALQQAAQDLPSFRDEISTGLQNLLSFYQCREIPRPSTLKRIVLQIATFEFTTKPTAAIEAVRSGVPAVHAAFWKKMPLSSFYSIYKALSVSPSKGC